MRTRIIGPVVVATGMAMAVSLGAQAETSITFSYCCEQQDRHDYFHAMAQRYEEAHPGVKVNVLDNVGGGKLKTLIAAGETPDVFWTGFNWYGQKNLVQTVDPFLKANPGFTSDLDPNVLRLFQLDGKTYGLPLGVAPRVIAYNKDMLEANGMAAPTSSWDWSQLLAMAHKLTRDTNGDGRVDTFGLSTYWWPWGFLAYGQPYYYDDGKLFGFKNVEAATDAWQIDIDTWSHQNGLAPANTKDSPAALFAGGKLAFLDVGAFDIPDLRQKMTGSWGLQTFPWLNEGNQRYRATWSTGEAFVISKDSKHPKMAMDFVKFILEPKQIEPLVASGAIMPASRTLQNSDLFLRPNSMPLNMHAFVESTAFGSSPFAGVGEPIAWSKAASIMGQANSGKEPAKTYMKQLLSAVNAGLAAQ